MKTSVIRQRVADFLRCHAPFDSLAPQDLLELAGSGKVKFHQGEEYVEMKGDKPGAFVWVVQQGRLEVVRESAGGETLADVLGEGDLIGLERFAGVGVCQHSTRTLGDVLLYGVDANAFEALSKRYVEVQRFLEAGFSMQAQVAWKRSSWLDAEPPPASFVSARTNRLRLVASEEICPPLETRRLVTEMLHRGVDSIRMAGTTDVVRAADLALFCGFDAPRLVSEIQQAGSPAEMEPLIRLSRRMIREAMAEPKDLPDCRLMAAKVMAAAIKPAIQRSGGEAAGCWTLFGSAARMDLPQAQWPTLGLIGEGLNDVGDWLRDCGLTATEVHWPSGLGPTSSLENWKRVLSETVAEPLENSIYLRRELFDMKAIQGDFTQLEDLKRHVQEQLRANDMAIALLANDTVDHLPPLTFFEGLVVGLDGSRRESFDIEKTIIEPVADAARVFALAEGKLDQPGTLERLEDGGDVFQEAAEAFRIGIYHHTIAGTRMIHPGKLSKLDQKLLKTAIASVQRLLALTVRTFVEQR